MFTDENWRGKMQGASAEIDSRFGERFYIGMAQRRPNHAVEPSGEGVFEIDAVFSYRSETAFRHEATTRQAGGTLVETRVPTVSFSHRACPVMIKHGDVLTRFADGTQWEVKAIKPDGVSRIVLDLVQRGVQAQ